jgi:hypothetical protein
MSLQNVHSVDIGLSEDEQLQLALLQSQEEEDRAQATRNRTNPAPRQVHFEPSPSPSMTRPLNTRPVLGAIASYPPGPVTEQEASSIVSEPPRREQNLNALHGLLTPGSSRPSTPGSNASRAVDSGIGMGNLDEVSPSATPEPSRKSNRSSRRF